MTINHNTLRKEYTITAGEHQIVLGKHTRIMGIINITPDSFSGDGCLKKKHNTIAMAKKMIRNGADILDIGGESSRPGAHSISSQEEIKRIIPTVTALAKSTKTPISVDTYKTTVAMRALDAGATIINTIKGTNPSKSLLKMVKKYKAAIVLMHMRGIPTTMQKKISYKNVIKEIISSLHLSIKNCLDVGIPSNQIIIDPGIGFGKTVEHNFEIINHLEIFQKLKKPILLGVSRKSFIGEVLNKNVADRLIGTVASVCAGIMHGAHIVRVHDITPIKEAATMTDAIVRGTL